MGFLNLNSSLRYGPSGKKRKTTAFTTKSKRTKYKELLSQQQEIYDQVMKEVEKEEYPSYVGTSTGAITPLQEPMRYTGERKYLGSFTMHKSNMVPVFEDDKQHAIDIARMRR